MTETVSGENSHHGFDIDWHNSLAELKEDHDIDSVLVIALDNACANLTRASACCSI